MLIAPAALAAAVMLDQGGNMLVVVCAAAFGAYMALNIGANNMGPAVGANALTMGGAIAVVFESAGALLAADGVVSIIRRGSSRPRAWRAATSSSGR